MSELVNLFTDVFTEGIRKEDFIQVFNDRLGFSVEELDWSNCTIAGGSIVNILSGIEIEGSDIDFFVYGDAKQVWNKIKYLMFFFSKKYNLENVTIINRGVIEFKNPFNQTKIQIVWMLAKTISEILDWFDMDYVKGCFNGTDFFGTIDFIESFKTKKITKVRYGVKSRIEKAKKKGYTFACPITVNKPNSNPIKEVISFGSWKKYMNKISDKNSQCYYVNNFQMIY